MTEPLVPGVGILGLGAYLPDQVVSNDDLIARYAMDVTADWIESKTGIRSRTVAFDDETTSDLAVRAAQCALADAHLTPTDLDGLIVATSTPDMLQPSTACIVQGQLGALRAFAFDVDAVCSGFTYALVVAASMMRADPRLVHVMVVGAEVYSRVLDYGDPTTAVLFGDGAGAAVLSRIDGAAVLGWDLGADGIQSNAIRIPAGGTAMRADSRALSGGMDRFHMDGKAVGDFVRGSIPHTITRLLTRAELEPEALGLFVPHQANAHLMRHLCDATGIPQSTMASSVGHLGNLGAASIPVTYWEARAHGRIAGIKTVLFAGFGGGLTWASVLLACGGEQADRTETP